MAEEEEVAGEEVEDEEVVKVVVEVEEEVAAAVAVGKEELPASRRRGGERGDLSPRSRLPVRSKALSCASRQRVIGSGPATALALRLIVTSEGSSAKMGAGSEPARRELLSLSSVTLPLLGSQRRHRHEQ